MKIILFAADANENSLGRVYVLWLLARELGWEVHTVARRGGTVWKPLESTEFGKSIVLSPGAKELDSLVSSADALIGCKPRPESAGWAIGLGRQFGKPVLIDVDDPDLEFQFDFLTRKMRFRRWLRPIRRLGYLRLRRILNRYPVLVSNPVLQEKYGGWVIPHARVDAGLPQKPDGDSLTIAFVGTVQTHKGIGDLRESLRLVNRRQGVEPIRLNITAEAPDDAEAWENWIGMTPFALGLEIVRAADIVVLPSRRGSWSDAQLPAKLMDAMLAGCAVCVTDVGPLPWAVADAAEIVPPRDPKELARVLEGMRDETRRTELGAAARAHALRHFTVQAIAPEFETAVRQSTSRWGSAND